MAMSIHLEAIYENGVFRPLQPVSLAENQRVTITLEGEAPPAALPLHADRHPLRVDDGGAVRVGRSRIRLGLVVEQYENGMTPEDMVRAYDTLLLADVHAVIAYYLRHRDEVRVYLRRRKEEADALQAKIEAERPRVSRQELLARRNVPEKADAPAGQ
jgi:uncharacterized protein (DUF433 family)